MKSKQIRAAFLDYFRSQDHKIVASAPIVNKDDPTLMFTNAGMNQFKDFFLGNEVPDQKRVADTQKCLRVSGKHNDLEEVGFDGYHHTMFEMLGNWSFGDYFKKEAIDMAWTFLTDVLGVDKNLLYATVFEGDESDNLEADEEAEGYWGRHLPTDRILRCNKKDNFWEMGETGPCGPCSEIHIDLRSEEEKAKVPGRDLVNKDHPEVIEIWNLVFIQYNRSFGGDLSLLPEKHIDTGMGFERLCMVMQNKTSSYDTDIFTPYIRKIEHLTARTYKGSYDPQALSDVAFRVVVDHLRAVVFAIADGQIPGNTGAGYVIRRILRRAVRYYYSFLGRQEPLLKELVPVMVQEMGSAFPELGQQEDTISKVIEEEEHSFLRTLEKGLLRLDQLMEKGEKIPGEEAFELYDTYGFPIDLTILIAEEKGFKVDVEGFRQALQEQKERSRADAKKEVRDWVNVHVGESEFVGYDQLEVSGTRILRYRSFLQKGKERYQVVLEKNPFYAEGGGQIGDSGRLVVGGEELPIVDTIRENDLFLLITPKMIEDPGQQVNAIVDGTRRRKTENNHSATHLVHSALRQVLGDHVQQKGSLVTDGALRFDFSHFAKVTEEEILEIEQIVNRKIRENIAREEAREVDIEEAKEAGAMMLFGEKYGDKVRMITFDPGYSVELCGGCHVDRTGRIGMFKIVSESSVAAGVRRIEALTADAAEEYIRGQLETLNEITAMFKNPSQVDQQVAALIEENKTLKREMDKLKAAQAGDMKQDLMAQATEHNGFRSLVAQVDLADAKIAKDLIYQIEQSMAPAIVLFGFVSKDKPQLMCRISESLTSDDIHAGKAVKKFASAIRGGGGGQPFFATAGGSDTGGMPDALEMARTWVGSLEIEG
jgi:alanyl-tRNA synthetase